MFYGDKDALCTSGNINNILTNVPNVKAYYLENWGHATYLFGNEKELLFGYFDEILLD